MSRNTRSDDGIGLIEIIVSMMLLGVLALGILPLLIQATTASVANRDLVAANSVAAAELAPIREDFPNSPDTVRTCASVPVRAMPDEDDDGDGYVTEVELVACTAGTATIAVKVFRFDESDALVEIATKVMVSG